MFNIIRLFKEGDIVPSWLQKIKVNDEYVSQHYLRFGSRVAVLKYKGNYVCGALTKGSVLTLKHIFDSNDSVVIEGQTKKMVYIVNGRSFLERINYIISIILEIRKEGTLNV